MPDNANRRLPVSAYDILAYALQLKQHPTIDNVYLDRNNIHYRRTKWGFEKAERLNLRLALRRMEKECDLLAQRLDDLSEEYDHLLKRKTGLLQHLDAANNKLKEHRRERGFLKKYLKEVLDKNLSLDKRMERMTKREQNLLQQIDNLKSTKDNLLENNLHLTNKNREQKNQIQTLQKVVEELKSEQKKAAKVF
ncbi:hypothetical protein [Carboxylicivirga taeanensis]|uniref:hypothetical protein n=1 Tax=Carboxylicivirga taeanensis TaxID=1416875 RepID=UPI003F6E1645